MKALVAILGILGCTWALADDGWVGNGGTPKLMASHPAIRMVSEVVNIHVGPYHTTTNCSFVFHNAGPATDVKIGFPDEDSTREDGYGSVFQSFQSWVNGRRVKTKLEKGQSDDFWQTKTVHFNAGQTLRIRDRYRLKTSLGNQGYAYTLYAAYTLHTGASWSGTIGTAKIIVTLDHRLARPKRLAPTSVADDWNESGSDSKLFLKRHRRTVFWSGGAKPTLHGRSIVFSFNNLKPKEEDDLFLILQPISPVRIP